MNAAVLETEFDGALAAWDAHVDRCPVCLVEGTTLCYEGHYLSEDVIEVREALGAAELKARTFLEGALSEPAALRTGVAA